jgi:integrase
VPPRPSPSCARKPDATRATRIDLPNIDRLGLRWVEHGKRRRNAGFASRSAALAHYRDVIRPRLNGASTIDPSITLSAFVDLYLESHALNVEPSTLAVLRDRLRRATERFGSVRLRDLERQAPEIAAWRASLAEGSRFGATQALRQTLEQAVRWHVMPHNPAKLAGANPQPKRAEIVPFTPVELDQLCDELGPWAPLVRFAAATGLRPCEWIALERRDVKADGVVLVERAFSRGQLTAYSKTARSRRRVPLSTAARAALADLPPRIDTPLLFPSLTGLHLRLGNWHRREWKPALEASGVRHGTIYTLRHTFATNALAVGLSIFELSRYMGTSVEMIDRTYGHLAVGSEQAARAKLDALGGA